MPGHFSSQQGGHGEEPPHPPRIPLRGEINNLQVEWNGKAWVALLSPLTFVEGKEAGTFANVFDFGASSSATPKENSTAIKAAQASLSAQGGDLFFPESLTYDETLVPTDGMRLIGRGAQQRWRSSRSAVKLTYVGVGQAVHIFNTAAETREAVEIWGLRFDGKENSGAVDGLFVDGTEGNATNYVEGIYLFDSAFTNFPRYQVLGDGLIIDLIFERCALNNIEAPSENDLFHGQHTTEAAKVITQLSFNECLIAQYGKNAWGARCGAADTRFDGGTVTTNGQEGGSGIITGPITLMGTHLEGIGEVGVGLNYTGSNNATIQPSYCASFATGIEIGAKGGAGHAIGAVINGMVGGNTVDIRITNGGTRKKTIILNTGEASGGPPVVEDERFSIDGVHEVLRLDKGPIAKPAENSKAIIEALEQLGLVT